MLYEEYRTKMKSIDIFKHLSDEDFDKMINEVLLCKPKYLDIPHWIIYIAEGTNEGKESFEQVKKILKKYDIKSH